MAYLVIGLDRGTCEVKAVILERSFRGNEVKGTRVVRVPQDGSGPPSEEAVEAAVAQIVDEFDPGAVGYVTDFRSERASVWFVPLPFTDQRRIDQTLPFELENHVPFDLDDMVLDYRVVRAEHGESRVLAALAPRNEMRDTLQALKKFKVDPRAVILDGDALAQVPPGKNNIDKTLAIVDLGHTQTIVTVRRGAQTDFIRAIPQGGLQVTQAVMERFGVNYRTAEEMKIRLRPVDPIPDDQEQAELEGGEARDGGAEESESAIREGTGGSGTVEGEGSSSDRGGAEGSSSDSTLEEFRRIFDPDGEEAGSGQELSSLEPVDDQVRDPDAEPTVRVEAEHAPAGEMGEQAVSSPAEHAWRDEGASPGEPDRVPPTEATIRQVVENAMQPLLREVRSALIAYEGKEHREVDAMLLIGGGALFEGLPEAFEETLGIPVGRPSRLGPDQMTVSAPETLCRYAKAFALAYLGATDSRQGAIDFRTGEFSFQKSYLALRRYLLAAAVLVFLGIIVATGMFVSEVQKLRRESRELDNRIAEAIKAGFPELDVDVSRGIEMAIAKMREQYATMEARGKRLGIGDARRTSIDLLREISAVVPGSDEVKIDVDDFSFEGNQIKLRGTADKFESIDKVEKAIQSSDMVLETKSEVGSKGEKKNFNLVITLREPGDDSSY